MRHASGGDKPVGGRQPSTTAAARTTLARGALTFVGMATATRTLWRGELEARRPGAAAQRAEAKHCAMRLAKKI